MNATHLPALASEEALSIFVSLADRWTMQFISALYPGGSFRINEGGKFTGNSPGHSAIKYQTMIPWFSVKGWRRLVFLQAVWSLFHNSLFSASRLGCNTARPQRSHTERNSTRVFITIVGLSSLSRKPRQQERSPSICSSLLIFRENLPARYWLRPQGHF